MPVLSNRNTWSAMLVKPYAGSGLCQQQRKIFTLRFYFSDSTHIGFDARLSKTHGSGMVGNTSDQTVAARTVMRKDDPHELKRSYREHSSHCSRSPRCVQPV